MNKLYPSFSLLILLSFSLSAQFDLMNCDTINFADSGQCHLNEFTLSNVAVVGDGSCDNDSIYWEIYVDTWSDGLYDFEFNSYLDSTDNNIFDDTNENGIYDVFAPPTLTGEEVAIIINQEIPQSAFVHSVFWIAHDGCGNQINCNSGFKIQDIEAPEIICSEEKYTVYTTDDANDLELDLERVILFVSDNCTPEDNLIFTLGDNVEVPNLEFSVLTDDIILELKVFDEYGNYSECDVDIDFIALPFPYDCFVRNVLDDTMEGVKVDVNSEFIGCTDDEGRYIAFVSSDFDYTISAQYDDNLNGVSTKDLILLKEYLEGNSSLSSPLDIIACDVNADHIVDESDLDYLKDLLLRVETDSSLWKFLDYNIQFVNENSPFPYEEGITHVAETEWQRNDLIGIKLGDIDHSAISHETDTTGSIIMSVENRIVSDNTEIEIDFFLPAGLVVRGIQLPLVHDMSYTSIQSGTINISDEDIFIAENNDLIIVCPDGGLTTNQPAFTITFQSNSCNELKRKIRELEEFPFFEDILSAEIYLNEDLSSQPLKFVVEGEVEYTENIIDVRPNPFSDHIVIPFVLDQAASIDLQVFDVSGRLLSENELGVFSRGKNEIYLTDPFLIFPHSGMYLFKFKIVYADNNLGSDIITKKVVYEYVD